MKTAELQLLAQAGLNPIRETVPLEQASLMEGQDPTQRARLAACLHPTRLAAGELLFHQGDPGAGCTSSPRAASTFSARQPRPAPRCRSAT